MFRDDFLEIWHEAYLLASVSPVFVDFAAVRRDFKIPNATDSEIIELLSSYCVISEPHLRKKTVNSIVKTSGSRQVFRYRSSGRSCQIPYSESLNVDVKGSGVRPNVIPKLGWHSDGMYVLPQACKEYFFAKLIEKILGIDNFPITVAPVYAVFHTGLMLNDKPPIPTALLIRRGGKRGISDLPEFGSLRQQTCAAVELLLRTYGITFATTQFTINKRREVYERQGGMRRNHNVPASIVDHIVDSNQIKLPFTGDFLNIQLTAPDTESCLGQIVDLTHCRFKRNSGRALLSSVSNQELGWGGIIRGNFPRSLNRKISHPISRYRAPRNSFERSISHSIAGLRQFPCVFDWIPGALSRELELPEADIQRRNEDLESLCLDLLNRN